MSFQENVALIEGSPGLAAFWTFRRDAGLSAISSIDINTGMPALPFKLGRVGDPEIYNLSDWPYKDEESRLVIEDTGPFGGSIRLNRGYIYGIVPRPLFDGSPLDLRRRRPFTMMAWMRFTGERHLIGGIWDEGGWDRYGGRRQVALFGGLFDQRGVIAHVSATGAACFPQSDAPGSEFARTRAIDGAPIEDGEWACLAMTFDPASDRISAYKNGVLTPLAQTDPVRADVAHITDELAANPIEFTDQIFHPDCVLLKFSGYDYRSGGAREHKIHVDFRCGTITYEREGEPLVDEKFHVVGIVGTEPPQSFTLSRPGEIANFAPPTEPEGTHLHAKLIVEDLTGRSAVGSPLDYVVRQGAPFTFGRAPGVGDHGLQFGSQLDLSGFAVFNRVLSEAELVATAFGR